MNQKHSFVRQVKKAQIAPLDGAEPLTVVEFSLVPEVRRKLKERLLPFTRGRIDDEKLSEIISTTFPKEVLDELSALGKKDTDAATVFVVRNLPGFGDEKLRSKYKVYSKEEAPTPWTASGSYATAIARGVALAAGLKPGQPYELFRAHNHQYVFAGELHKHQEDVTALSVSKADGAATRFVDFQALTEDAAAQEIYVEGVAGSGTLSELQAVQPELRPAQEVQISAAHYDVDSNNAYNALLQKHAVDVRTTDGDLVLWSNHGRVWHQALKPPHRDHSSRALSRAAFSVPISH